MSRFLYGAKSDNLYWIWGVWAHTRVADPTCLVNYPFGSTIGTKARDPFMWWPTVFLAFVTNEVVAFNVITMLGFTLSALFMYAVVRRLTAGFLPAVVCGLAFAILPYRLAMSQYHFGLGRTEVLPAFLYMLLLLRSRPGLPRLLCTLLVLGISFLVEPHYGLFNLVLFLIFTFLNLLNDPSTGWKLPKPSKLLRSLTMALAGIATGIPRYILMHVTATEVAPRGRPIEQLHAYSARFWQYITPPVQHPLLGQLSKSFVGSRIHDSYWHEHTLYVGLAIAFFAVIGICVCVRSARSEKRFWGLFFVLVVIIGFVFSMPPTVNLGSLEVPMPSSFLHAVFPMLRVYARFGIVVATALVALAGLGLSRLLGRVRKKRTVSILVAGLILFEFLSVPPAHYVDLSETPAVYQFVGQREEIRAIAEYPLGFPPEKIGEHLNLWDIYEYMLWQRAHGKPLFNGEPDKLLDLALKSQLRDPSDPKTPVRLRWLGISHLVIHRERVDCAILQKLALNQDLEEVYSSGQASVYRILGSEALFLPNEFYYTQHVRVDPGDGSEVPVKLQVPGNENDTERLIVFGPYATFPTGDYRVQFVIAQEENADGKARLVVVIDNGRTVLAEKEVAIAAKKNPVVEFHTQGILDVEFRIYSNANTLWFGGVMVEPLQMETGNKRY